ncbi:MAG: hypothetical protein F6K56_24755 [Moorea sp. SIO3G5]|nr:hypothetical protein [Moorena sp. SIO3G5]
MIRVFDLVHLIFAVWVVRYGAGYFNKARTEHQGNPAPNAPYWRGKLNLMH